MESKRNQAMLINTSSFHTTIKYNQMPAYITHAVTSEALEGDSEVLTRTIKLKSFQTSTLLRCHLRIRIFVFALLLQLQHQRVHFEFERR